MELKNELKWVTDAQLLSDYKLHLTFNDGGQRIFDCQPLIGQYPFFAPLRNKAIFDNFNLDGWTICWQNGNIDIAPEYLYVKQRDMKQRDRFLFHKGSANGNS